MADLLHAFIVAYLCIGTAFVAFSMWVMWKHYDKGEPVALLLLLSMTLFIFWPFCVQFWIEDWIDHRRS